MTKASSPISSALSLIITCLKGKVGKILKGSLDLTSSPSVTIHVKGGKVCLRRKGKTLLGVVNNHLNTELKFADIAKEWFAFTPQANFPAHNMNFHLR